jgi:hypothetical protein
MSFSKEEKLIEIIFNDENRKFRLEKDITMSECLLPPKMNL